MPDEPRVVVAGHLDVDRITTETGTREGLLGGSAVYTALAASIRSPPVGLVGTTCADYPYHRFEEAADGRLRPDLVRVLGSQRRNHLDYTVETEGPSDRTTHTYSTEQWRERTELHAPRHVPQIREGEVFHLSPMLPRYQRLYAEWAHDRGFTVSLDTSEYYAANLADELADVVRRADLLVLSEVEFEHLYPGFIEEPRRYVDRLLDGGPDVVVVRQGEDGCLVAGGDSYRSFDALPANVVDPTGAGDSFNGGFVSAYAESSLTEACTHAIATAKRCIEDVGVRGLIDASLTEIERDAAAVTHTDWR